MRNEVSYACSGSLHEADLLCLAASTADAVLVPTDKQPLNGRLRPQ